MTHPARLILPLALLGACAPVAGDFGTGARLSVDYFGDTDVVGFHYEVSNTSCAGEPIVPSTQAFNVHLLDNIFPGMVTHVETVLDPDSRHLGADLFLSLEPGCYTVTATPASAVDVDDDASWTASADCSTATSDAIEVVDGWTTEAPVLVSQCQGDPIGALDQTVVLNHPPVISVTIDEKYNYECEAVEACVTAYDPDDDPLEFLFEKLSGPAHFALTQSTPEIIGFEDGHRVWRVCAEIVTRWTTSYDYGITVWDFGPQGRFEDVTGLDSHDSLHFPIHTNWIEEPLCFDDVGALVPAPGVDIDRAPGCSYIDAETFYCSGNYPVDPTVASYLCDGNTLNESALYPNCDGTPSNPPDPELPCDGLDNDGDGDIDEGSTYGDEYTWLQDPAHPQSDTGGFMSGMTMTYNDLAETLRFAGTIAHPSNGPTNFFEFAVDGGPNPSGSGDLAMFYVDFTAGAPIVTVYAYNALGAFSSHVDGSTAAGVQPPDVIDSSLLNPNLIVAQSWSNSGGQLVWDLTFDVAGVNSHAPAYGPLLGWDGAQFGDEFGLWFHPATEVTTAYSGGFVSNLTWGPYGWFDTAWQPATGTPICQ